MTGYDEIAEADGDDECRAWIRRVIEAKEEVVSFVDARLNGGGRGRYIGFLKGSFNLSLHIGFGDDRHSALIRFPKPGHAVWRTEKVTNEVRTIEYLRQTTSIPLPCIRLWGLTEESPLRLGPFIVMDFIKGVRLSTFLKQQTKDDQEDVILDPDIDNVTMDAIYLQLADYLLQMSRLGFSRIGAISKDDSSNEWTVTTRPLTYNMNELATTTGYPMDHFPTEPFERASDYFGALAEMHLTHFRSQRNLAKDSKDAQSRFIARHRFKQLIPKYCIHNNSGPFMIFCDDMQPSNMLIDPETLRITAVLDFEFTNAMPAQFSWDPPWWLLLLGPDMWLERYSMKEFLSCYEPRLEQFLRALERVEMESAPRQDQLEEPRLSTRMREAWETKRFWFDFAARKSLDVDTVYWNALHGEVDLLDEKAEAELVSVAQMKMEQLKAYREEYSTRFSQDD